MAEKCRNRRKGRRYSLKVTHKTNASLETADGRSYDGHLADVSIAGAAVRFAGKSAPRLRVGQEITITLRVPLTSQRSQILDIRAVVRNLVVDANTKSVRCGFEFDRRIEVDSPLYEAIRTLANRRAAQRIAPSRQEEMTIVLRTAEGTAAEGRIKDISDTGVGIIVGGALESDTIGLDSIALSFHLPTEDHDTTLTGQIRHQETQHDQTIVGVEFDDESEDFKDHRKEIVRYLMQRQRELLKK